MERCREIEQLERDRLIQMQERERHDNAEQAVDFHFQETFRRVKENVSNIINQTLYMCIHMYFSIYL